MFDDGILRDGRRSTKAINDQFEADSKPSPRPALSYLTSPSFFSSHPITLSSLFPSILYPLPTLPHILLKVVGDHDKLSTTPVPASGTRIRGSSHIRHVRSCAITDQ
jgi:hypothetical protein